MIQSDTLNLNRIYTVGVYGSTEDAFFGALVDNEIDLFIDVRARRGLRGSKYKYANSIYLQSKLDQLGIAYAHMPELAPTKEIRAAQNLADRQTKTAKRARTTLSDEFVRAYRRDVLKAYKRKPEHKFNAAEILRRARELAAIPLNTPTRTISLFCVEREPAACHRSLMADALGRQLSVDVEHI